MKDDRVSKTPLWRQPLVVVAAAAALMVAGGVGWSIYPAEELDEQLDRQTAVADRPDMLTELEQAWKDFAAHDAERHESEHDSGSRPLTDDDDEARVNALLDGSQPSLSSASDAPSANAVEVTFPEQYPALVTVESAQAKPAERAPNTPSAPEPVAADSPAPKQTAALQPTVPRSAEPSLAEPAPPRPPNWMKVNENGEPCEVTLADGTALKLDTYGDEYDAYKYRPPLTGAKAEFVFGTDRGPNVGWGGLAIDPKHKTIYWVEGTSKVSRIMRAGLNGEAAGPLMDFSELCPVHVTPDPVHGKLYWRTGGLLNNRPSIYCTDLNGKHASALIQDFARFRTFTIDPAGNKLYYFDGHRLIQTDLDGKNETAILETEALVFSTVVDHEGGKIYWSDGRIGRANLDGSNIENAIQIATRLDITLDASHGLIYWPMGSTIRRAHLDGSQTENIVVDLAGSTSRIALDVERGYMLWCATDIKKRGRRVGVWRTKLPPAAKSTRKPAPPLIRTIAPEAVAPGEEATVTGAGFNSTKEVLVLDDGTGENRSANFTVRSDRELSVTVPRMSERSRRPLLVVRNGGGITVTLPRGVGASRHAQVDRFHPDEKFAYVVPSDGIAMVDRGAVLAMGTSRVTPGERGHSIFFVKNGAQITLRRGPDNVVFFEPFAFVPSKEASKGSRLVPVSAIRPSFVGSVLEYKQQ